MNYTIVHALDDSHFFIVAFMLTPTYVSAGFGSIQVPGTWMLRTSEGWSKGGYRSE